MKAGGHDVKVINKMIWHDLSHADEDALRANVAKGAGKVKEIIVEEPIHQQTHILVSHHLELKYQTSQGTFLYCKAASNFNDALAKLKSCKKE